jgi:hypothetical protein
MIKIRKKCGKKAKVQSQRTVETIPCDPLPPQLRVDDRRVLEPTVRPVRNDAKSLSKPRGGFWTSTYYPDYGSGWVCYCIAYRYNEPFELHWSVLSVAGSARVAVIDSAEDLAELINRYPRMALRRRGLDFEALAHDYDALRLTHEGYLRTRSRRRGPALIGWDCESTLWFRWVFTECRDVQPYVKDVDRFDEMWLTLSGWSAEDYRCHRMPEDKASRKVYETMLREDAAECKGVKVKSSSARYALGPSASARIADRNKAAERPRLPHSGA